MEMMECIYKSGMAIEALYFGEGEDQEGYAVGYPKNSPTEVVSISVAMQRGPGCWLPTAEVVRRDGSRVFCPLYKMHEVKMPSPAASVEE